MVDPAPRCIFANAPAERDLIEIVPGAATVVQRHRTEQQLARFAIDLRAVQHGISEESQIGRARDHAGAERAVGLVTGLQRIDTRGGDFENVRSFRIPLPDVLERRRRLRRQRIDELGQGFFERPAADCFVDSAEQRVAMRRIAIRHPRLRKQRAVAHRRKRCDRVGVVRLCYSRIARLVVGQAGRVCEQFERCDRLVLLGQAGQVGADRRVRVQPALLHQQREHRAADDFRDACETKPGVNVCRPMIADIDLTNGRLCDKLAIQHDRNRVGWHAGLDTEAREQGVDGCRYGRIRRGEARLVCQRQEQRRCD